MPDRTIDRTVAPSGAPAEEPSPAPALRVPTRAVLAPAAVSEYLPGRRPGVRHVPSAALVAVADAGCPPASVPVTVTAAPATGPLESVTVPDREAVDTDASSSGPKTMNSVAGGPGSGVVSHASPVPSPSLSVCAGSATSGQVSDAAGMSSPSSVIVTRVLATLDRPASSVTCTLTTVSTATSKRCSSVGVVVVTSVVTSELRSHAYDTRV